MAIIRTGMSRHDGLVVCTDWTGYRRMGDLLGDRRVRLSYDQGQLEIMTLGAEHERLVRLLDSLLQAYLSQRNRPYVLGGATTFRRRDKQKGFEPDSCYWLETASQMVGITKWNAQLHPPPDVAVEVTITHGLLDRLGIYAAVGVPEVWWYHDGKVEVLHLSEEGAYRSTSDSSAFPALPPAVIAEHLALSDRLMDSDIIGRFRSWLKDILDKGPAEAQ